MYIIANVDDISFPVRVCVCGCLCAVVCFCYFNCIFYVTHTAKSVLLVPLLLVNTPIYGLTTCWFQFLLLRAVLFLPFSLPLTVSHSILRKKGLPEWWLVEFCVGVLFANDTTTAAAAAAAAVCCHWKTSFVSCCYLRHRAIHPAPRSSRSRASASIGSSSNCPLHHLV